MTRTLDPEGPMYFRQLLLEGLGCMTYLVGDEATGEAAVIDPQIAIADAMGAAEAAGLRVVHALDTHVHADHVSGARALAAATGAALHLPARARAAYPHEPLAEGSEIRLGDVLLRARETPGHTPEHLTFEVIDLSAGTERPYALLTGDTLLVGSAGRPDLAGSGDATALAGMMFDTLRRVLARAPDGTLVFPGHGAGSACGANVRHLPATTIGYEKDANPYLAIGEREPFVERLTRDLPPKPGNAANIKRINARGPPDRPPRPEEVPALDPEAFAARVGDARGVLVVDTREPDAFAANHVPGSMNVTLDSPQFPSRVAHLLEWDKPVYLVLDDAEELPAAVIGLARVGGLDVRGLLEGGIDAWRNAGLPLGTFKTLGAREVEREIDSEGARVLDVRSASEWDEGHVPGATWIPWEGLDERLDELDRDATWITICGSGYRSTIAASLLAREGFPRVANALGGMTAWNRRGGELARAPRAEAPRRAA